MAAALVAFIVSAILLVTAWFSDVRKRREQRQRGYAPGTPGIRQPDGISDDMLELVRQDKRIKAIKRYRELNPDVSLRQAKHVIDQI